MKENPEKLTRREEELMRCFWEHGPLFVRELVALSPDPKPHFNTLSTMVRALEAKGYVAHNSFGSTYQYYPVVSEEEFSRSTLGSVISRYFENSYLGAVSALVEEEKISLGELAERVDITPANLSILKNGKAKAIRFSTLEAICRELDCQPGDIIEYRPEETQKQ